MESGKGDFGKPDRLGGLIAGVAGPGLLLLAHLAAPHISLWLLLLPSIVVAALLAVALRRGRRLG
ncbi:hypothetical protein [Streptomyces sp. NPDC049915]|uniref:hypothetical protein n=1 Tax=Streptomyces sp. NPDC049915 TaxID=3155510 RepID=UPI00342ED6E9